MASLSQPRSALDLWSSHADDTVVLQTGCTSIDDLLGGGFRSGLLTEVCGEASAGKTQLCLQLLLQACLPTAMGGLGGTACYISTEGIGSIKRLHELAGEYNERYGEMLRKRRRLEVAQNVNTPISFLDGIFIEQAYEAEDLVDVVQTKLPSLLAERNTKLVVIDSIAAVFRLESTGSVQAASERSRLMFHLANCMRILSAQFQVIFVITNQVTGNVVDGEASFRVDQRQFKPALGLSWSHCINQRLMLHRSNRSGARRMEIIFSPCLPAESTTFQITSAGLTSTEQ
ncbi:hypothetical protein PINS_up011616 [Pythium insidiosum]|nr:hypothetical protein PINS_up011616 [Pythium insidiosum]